MKMNRRSFAKSVVGISFALPAVAEGLAEAKPHKPDEIVPLDESQGYFYVQRTQDPPGKNRTWINMKYHGSLKWPAQVTTLSDDDVIPGQKYWYKITGHLPVRDESWMDRGWSLIPVPYGEVGVTA